jgi:hypothetical protein
LAKLLQVVETETEMEVGHSKLGPEGKKMKYRGMVIESCVIVYDDIWRDN